MKHLSPSIKQIVKTNKEGEIHLQNFRKLIKKKTKVQTISNTRILQVENQSVLLSIYITYLKQN